MRETGVAWMGLSRRLHEKSEVRVLEYPPGDEAVSLVGVAVEPLPTFAGPSNEEDALCHEYRLNGDKTALLQREYAAMAKET